MRCPYPECQKGYNEKWPDAYNDYVNPDDFGGSVAENQSQERVYIVTRRCHFCHKYFREIYVGHENPSVWNENIKQWAKTIGTYQHLATYPTSKTSFRAKRFPRTSVNISMKQNAADQLVP